MATEVKFTKGPWPWKYTGDGKRIVIGDGLVEGPRGYEVCEVYSDDCPQEVAEANANLIAAAPDLYEALSEAAKAFRKYEQSHNAKGSVEGAQKAAANAYLAKLCEAALNKANPSPA